MVGGRGSKRGTLRVGVPRAQLELQPVGGHGKVWSRVLAELRRLHPIVPLATEGSRLRDLVSRRPGVVLASGHDPFADTGLPLVVQLHEAGWLRPEHAGLLDPEFVAYISRQTEAAVTRAAHVIVPSLAAREEVIGAYAVAPARMHVVAYGVDPGFRPDVPGGRELVARVAGRPVPYVLYAATLHPRKNLSLLRDAFAQVVAAGFPHVLAIAGHAAPDRADSTELERDARAELPGAPGRVVWLGQPTDGELAALMAGADAFCLPSLHEGFGLTALEAMACGAPVVVSDRGALPEVVGDAGIVVEPELEALTAALTGVLSDHNRARGLGARAAQRARAFTWQRTAAGWSDVLWEASGRAGRAYTQRP